MLCEAVPSGALSRDACRCNGLVDSLDGESYRYRQQNLGTHVNNMGATGFNAVFYVRDKALVSLLRGPGASGL